jgi:hypothetical protein
MERRKKKCLAQRAAWSKPRTVLWQRALLVQIISPTYTILDRDYELGQFRQTDVIPVYRLILGAILVFFTIPS